jgi:hypothetical protein
MSHEELMHSIAIAQRDAGERAVIAHLQAQGLIEAPESPQQGNLALQTVIARLEEQAALHVWSSNDFFNMDPIEADMSLEMLKIARSMHSEAASELISAANHLRLLLPAQTQPVVS